jgi:hypothetical protein
MLCFNSACAKVVLRSWRSPTQCLSYPLPQPMHVARWQPCSVSASHASQLQAVLQSRPKPPSGFADPDAPKALSLSPGTRVVWVGQNYFGCVGTVLADPAAKVTGSSHMAGYIVRLQVGWWCYHVC